MRSTGGWVQRLQWCVSVCHGKEGAKPKSEALNLQLYLRSYPHLWSRAVGYDQKNKILGRVFKLSPRDMVGSSVIQDGLKSHCSSALRGAARCDSGTWLECLVDASPVRCFGHVPQAGGPRDEPGYAGETKSPGWTGNALKSLRKGWKQGLERGKSGLHFWSCCLHNPTLDKQCIMEGWMDGKMLHRWLFHLKKKKRFSRKAHLHWCRWYSIEQKDQSDHWGVAEAIKICVKITVVHNIVEQKLHFPCIFGPKQVIWVKSIDSLLRTTKK